MENRTLYSERLSSSKTEVLFISLTILFLALSAWRIKVGGLDALAIVFIFFFGIFLFYTVNYRTLQIQITAISLKLKFGIFTWTVPLDNIEDCRLDKLPPLLEYGGAGIHFMVAHERYRASFNFLEYPRVVVAFKKKVGPVRDISFSTREPEHIFRVMENNIPKLN